MRHLQIAVGLLVLATGSDVLCQEVPTTPAAEPSQGEEPIADAQATKTQPTEKNPTSSRREPRQWEREEERLRKITAKEGAEFSQEKFDGYRRRKTAGVVLVVAGPVLLVTSVIFAIASQPEGFSISSEGGDQEPERNERERFYLIAGWTTFGLSVASLGAGLPLLISGARGMKRQRYLQTRGGYLGPLSLGGVNLSFGADSRNRMAGLNVRFAF